MHPTALLGDLVIILGAAVIVVALLRRAGVPTIAGFILAGVVTGPGALRLIEDVHEVELLAEVGVILLLFGIGLELSLERIRRLWQAVLIGGAFQVTTTVIATAGIGYALGLRPGPAIFVGCIIAVSSTAVVLRGLAMRGELESPHGRLVVGILVFQDVCVVPMILAVPFLSGTGGSVADGLWAAGSALAIVVGVMLAAAYIAPRLLAVVARTRQRDLFVLTVFLICFGTAWAVASAGVSLALGAFLAGLVVAGSEFRHQAMSDLVPAREVLASLFFVSIGMLLDIGDVLAHWLPTLGLLAALLLGKFIIILATALLLRLPLQVAIISAAELCQVGEFSFVLLKASAGTGLLGEVLAHNLLVAIILSMLLTPLIISLAPHLALRAMRVPWINNRLGCDPPGVAPDEPHSDHVVIAGYGPTGKAICRLLEARGTAYVVIDANLDNVRAAREAGDHAVYGDVTQADVITELGCDSAALIVLCINDDRAAESAATTLRQIAPGVPVIARVQYELEREPMEAAGAATVISAEGAAEDHVIAAITSAFAARTASPTLLGRRFNPR